MVKQKLPERRRFVRIDVALKVQVKSKGYTGEAVTKNISPVGLRFETPQVLKEKENLDLVLSIPPGETPIHLKGIVIWQKRTSLEDRAPYDIGVEIETIEDKDKNKFLKYLCDLLYESTYQMRT